MRSIRRVPFGVPLLLAVLAFVPSAPAGASEPSATPQRPSLGTNASTVPGGRFELEAGAGLAEGGAALPLFAKYGWTDALELEVALDAVRRVDGTTAGDPTTSIGDLGLGARWRWTPDESRIQAALATLVKLPTAGDDTGSGETDVAVTAILSVPLPRGTSLDVNLVATALGRPGGGTLGQGQGIATYGFPVRGRWSGFVEAAWQRTAGTGEGGFLDAGLAYAATPRAVFDVAAGVGADDGYPDWSATVGWTVLFGSDR